MININTNQTLVITRDGEVTDEYEPNAIEQAKQAIRLELEMFVFDLVHRTHYRKIRHQLIEEKRRKEFEAKIGLVAR